MVVERQPLRENSGGGVTMDTSWRSGRTETGQRNSVALKVAGRIKIFV